VGGDDVLGQLHVESVTDDDQRALVGLHGGGDVRGGRPTACDDGQRWKWISRGTMSHRPRHLPSGLTIVFEVALRTCRPPTIHLISAGGFDGAVVHVSGTISPTRASVGPITVTWVGATGEETSRLIPVTGGRIMKEALICNRFAASSLAACSRQAHTRISYPPV